MTINHNYYSSHPVSVNGVDITSKLTEEFSRSVAVVAVVAVPKMIVHVLEIVLYLYIYKYIYKYRCKIRGVVTPFENCNNCNNCNTLISFPYRMRPIKICLRRGA